LAEGGVDTVLAEASGVRPDHPIDCNRPTPDVSRLSSITVQSQVRRSALHQTKAIIDQLISMLTGPSTPEYSTNFPIASPTTIARGTANKAAWPLPSSIEILATLTVPMTYMAKMNLSRTS
jgi:hypothetical protein